MNIDYYKILRIDPKEEITEDILKLAYNLKLQEITEEAMQIKKRQTELIKKQKLSEEEKEELIRMTHLKANLTIEKLKIDEAFKILSSKELREKYDKLYYKPINISEKKYQNDLKQETEKAEDCNVETEELSRSSKAHLYDYLQDEIQFIPIAKGRRFNQVIKKDDKKNENKDVDGER